MADYGIKVTNPGKDISSTTPEDYCLHSGYYGVIIAKETLGTLSIPGLGTAYATVSHSLGYVPITFIYTEHQTNKWYFGNYLSSDFYKDENTFYMEDAVVGTSNVIFNYVNNAAGTRTIRYKVYFLGENVV